MKLFLLLLVMNFCYAGTPAFTKLVGLELPALQIVYLRHTLALIAFLPWFLSQPHKRIFWTDLLKIALASALAFSSASILQVWGMYYSHAADGTFIMAMEPIIVIGLAYLFLKEKLDRRILFGLGLALIGFLVISNPSFNGRLLGNSLFLLAICCEATLPVLLKPLLKKYSPFLVAFYCLLFASFYLFPFQNGDFFNKLFEVSPQALASLLYLGLGCSFLGCLLWLSCLSKMTATFVAISWFLQPVFGCLIAFLLLGESFSPSMAVGGTFIFLALGLLTYQKRERPVQETHLRIQHPLWVPKPHKKSLPSKPFLPTRLSQYELAPSRPAWQGLAMPIRAAKSKILRSTTAGPRSNVKDIAESERALRHRAAFTQRQSLH